MRLNAYYYSFQQTGVEAIDRILSAVACAGKAFHHTEQWTDDVYDVDADGNKRPEPYEPFLRGWTPAEWIQNAANDAAAERDTLRARLDAATEYIALLEESERIAWPIAINHGIECPPEYVAKGQQLRERIAALQPARPEGE